MAKINVWIKDPGKPARHVWISDTLENLQKTVDGYIEIYPIDYNTIVICDEEGMFNNKRFNVMLQGMPLLGTIIIAGTEGAEIVSCPLDKEELKSSYPQLFEVT